MWVGFAILRKGETGDNIINGMNTRQDDFIWWLGVKKS
jgi:hypothetical protein